MLENYLKRDFYLDQGIENGSRMATHFVSGVHYVSRDVKGFNRAYNKIIDACERLKNRCAADLIRERLN